ncbi:hypothetical protein CHS0354_041544, partial [Potamilus streckersoni]
IKVRTREISPLRESENTDIPTNSDKDQTSASPNELNSSGISPSENVKDVIMPNSDITTTNAPRVRRDENIWEPAYLKD